MKVRWSLSAFYHGSWICLLALTIVVGWLSELVALSTLILAGACALWCLVPAGKFRYIPNFPPWARWMAAVAILAPVVSAYLRTKDLASLLGASLWTALLFFLPRKQKTLGHWIAILVAALLSLMSVIVKQEFSTYLIFLLFLMVLVLTLNANNLYSLAGATGAIRHRLSAKYFRQLGPSLFWGFAGGALVFFLFPRTQVFSNPWGIRERESTTGYTGKISLEKSNVILEDTAVAVTLEADPEWLAQNATSLYLRGNTLDRFNGVQWTSSDAERWPYNFGEDVRYSDSKTDVRPIIRLYRETHFTPAILYPGVLLLIKAPEPLLAGIRYDSGRNLYRGQVGSLRYSYDVVSSKAPSLDEIAQVPLSAMTASWEKELRQKKPGDRSRVPGRRYLQVPSSVSQAEYFKKWGEEVVKPRAPVTMGDFLAALSLNFSRQFTATLSHETTAGTALEGFLGASRKGHCEFFATAAALFLREKGIPTRIVLGYRGGTLNSVSRTMEVRERDAHAWVEVYGGQGRWYRYDPTPLTPMMDTSGLVAGLSLYYNALKFWFNRYVVHYNASAQQQMLTQAALFRIRPVAEQVDWRSVLIYLIGPGISLALWASYRRRLLKRRLGRDRLPSYYRVFLKRLGKSGWFREAGETFARFHDRIAREGFDPASLGRFDEALHRDLYSLRPLNGSEAHALHKWALRLPIQKKVAGPRQSG